MKKRIVSLLIAIMIFCSMLSAFTFAESETEFEGYIAISTKEQLWDVRYDVASNYYLTNDIEFTDEDYLPGGDFYNAGEFFKPIAGRFSGIFDGNGHAIKNLKINNKGSTTDYASLFVNISTTGVIRNLGIEGGIINSDGLYVSAFVGYNSGTIENCYNTATISPATISTSGRRSGGIVSNNTYNGVIKNCYNAGEITASCTEITDKYTGYSRDSYAGGIAAVNSGDIENCYNTGKIFTEVLYGTGSANCFAGGISANVESISSGSIINCYNTGDVSGQVLDSYNASYVHVGGIIGLNDSEAMLKDCYNEGSVCAIMAGYGFAGGIAGRHHSNYMIRNCYNLGRISSEYTIGNAYVGGVTGSSATNGSIKHCYNAGEISGKGRSYCYAGGLSGFAASRMEECYNNGNVTGETESVYDSYAYVGGIAGSISSQYVCALNCYNTGNVSGAAQYKAYVGGIAGRFVYDRGGNSLNSTSFYPCYNIGDVTASNSEKGTTYIGAVVGKSDEFYSGIGVNIFYHTKSGISAAGENGCYNVEKVSDYQMKNQVYLEYMDFEKVWYFDKSYGFDYPQLRSNPQTKPQSIELVSSTETITFKEGGTPDISGLQIKVVYENGLEDTKYITLSMLPELNLNQPGRQSVYVKFGDVYSEDAIEFNCIAKVLTGIEIASQPVKTEFHQGEAIDYKGLTVYARYDNNQRIRINDYQISELDTNTPGLKQVTISYEGFEAFFDVNVTAHYYYTYYNSQQHWSQCPDCGDKKDYAEHKYTNDCDRSCDCGYMRAITHKYVTKFDDVKHWEECSVCAKKGDLYLHYFSTNCDEACECGYTRKVTHKNVMKWDEQSHWSECRLCEKTSGESSPP